MEFSLPEGAIDPQNSAISQAMPSDISEQKNASSYLGESHRNFTILKNILRSHKICNKIQQSAEK